MNAGMTSDQRIRAFRLISLGWSHAAAADAVGTTRGTLSGIVRRSGYSRSAVEVLAKRRDIISLAEPKYAIYEIEPSTPKARRMKTVEANADMVGIDPKLVASRSQSRPVTIARWLSYQDMHDAGASAASIGRAFKRDHTSVLYGLAALHYINTGEARAVLSKRGIPVWIQIERSKREHPLSIESQ